MSTYLIGDIHGCYKELLTILNQVRFDPKVDTIWLTGDLVSRGPHSLEVLRLIHQLDGSARIVLGNHDLYLLKVYSAIHKMNQPKHYIPKNIISILMAPDIDELINWLRCQPILQIDEGKKLIMVHAGISPQWDIKTALLCAREVEKGLSSDSYSSFLDATIIPGDLTNTIWSPELSGIKLLQFSINVFTRMRYCFPNGQLEMTSKVRPEDAPLPLLPWFNIPGSVQKNYSIVFGHWSSLMGHQKGTPPGIYGLDSGCCWGGKLTLLRWEDKKFTFINCMKHSNFSINKS